MTKNSKKIDKRAELWGISFFSTTKDRLLNELRSQVEQGRQTAVVTTPNPEQVVQSLRDIKLKSILTTADWALPDGKGIVLASRFLHHRLGQPRIAERIAGVDVVADLLALAKENSWKVLCVGGRFFGTAQLPDKTVPLRVQETEMYWLPGYTDITHPSAAEESIVRQSISTLKPDIVLVAFGAPWQEYWIAEHLVDLKEAQVKVAMTVGGSFDYLLGLVPRAPLWLRDLGFEWLYRLLHQPWRWQRQLRLITFLGVVLQTWINPRRWD